MPNLEEEYCHQKVVHEALERELAHEAAETYLDRPPERRLHYLVGRRIRDKHRQKGADDHGASGNRAVRRDLPECAPDAEAAQDLLFLYDRRQRLGQGPILGKSS